MSTRVGNKVRPVREYLSTNRLVFTNMFRLAGATTLSVAGGRGDTSIFLSDLTGVSAGSHLILTNPATKQFHICDVVGDVYTGNEVPIDTPLDVSFGIGTAVTVGDHDMRVPAGTPAAPIIYQVRTPADTQSDVSLEIWRMMFEAGTTAVGDTSQFGSGDALTYGIVVRRVDEDGDYESLFNIKTNGDMKKLMFDFDILSAANPQQGQNGFAGRLSFNRLGGIVELDRGENLQLVIQDDLTTRVETMGVVVEGIIGDQ